MRGAVPPRRCGRRRPPGAVGAGRGGRHRRRRVPSRPVPRRPVARACGGGAAAPRLRGEGWCRGRARPPRPREGSPEVGTGGKAEGRERLLSPGWGASGAWGVGGTEPPSLPGSLCRQLRPSAAEGSPRAPQPAPVLPVVGAAPGVGRRPIALGPGWPVSPGKDPLVGGGRQGRTWP